MSNTERLKAIRTKCEELLEIAAKRTPGKWGHSENYLIGGWWVQDQTAKDREGSVADFCHEPNAAFIAACAGAAEAGWRATIVAIDSLPTIVRQAERIKRIRWGCDGDCGADGFACDCEDFANDAIKSILTAWEGIEL